MRSVAQWFLILASLVGGHAWAQQSSGTLASEAARSQAGSVGLELLQQDAGGAEFLAACQRSAAADAEAFAGRSGVSGVGAEVVGGHCACVAGMYFSHQQSPFYGRMQEITRRATSTPYGSIALAAVEDAKSRGGETQAAIAMGFAMQALSHCQSDHLDLKARAKAENERRRASEIQALIEAQSLSDTYVGKVEELAVRYAGATVVNCSQGIEWPDIYDVMFVLDPAKGRGDVFEEWATEETFQRFVAGMKTQIDDSLQEILPGLEAVRQVVDQPASQAVDRPMSGSGFKLVTEGDFYRLPLFDDADEIGYYCLSRSESGKSYFAGYPEGGKTMGKLNSFLNTLSGTQELPEATCVPNASARVFRDNGGAFLEKCSVVARGADAEAYIRKALLDAGKRSKAAPQVVRRTLEERAAEKEASRRF